MRKIVTAKKVFWLFVVAQFIGPVLNTGLINQATAVYGAGAGQTGGEFLRIGVGERAIGMGGAFSSIADNVTAVYWNPAGLTQLRMREFSAMHLNYLVDIKSEYLSYAQPLGNPEPGAVQGRFGTLGSQLSILISHHSRRDDFGNEIGDFYNYEGIFSLAYGYPLNSNFSLGVTLKSVYTNLDGDKTSALVVDFGGLYRTPIEGINLGLVIQNLNTGLKFTEEKEPVTPDFKVGISYRLDKSNRYNNGSDKSDHYNGNNLILATDINSFFSRKPNFSLGTEYSFVPPLIKGLKTAVRLGYQTRPIGTLGGLTGLTAGFGLEHKNKNFDYAFVPFGDLGNTHRVSFSMKF